MKYVIQTSADWRAQDNVRGTVRVANGATAWTGNSTTGSDGTPKEVDGYAVSPNGLKQALANYLPLNAKADNSALLNGLTSDQFIRRDINQTVNGSLTLTKVTTSSANIETSAILKSSKVETTGDIRISNATARLLLTSDTNAWSVQASANSGRIAFISENDTQNVHLSVYNDSRGVTANIKFEAPVINATTQFQLNGTGVIAAAGSSSIRLATSGKGLELASNDAGNIIAAEGSATYKVLTTKNKDSILDSRYVKSAGDIMTGNLTLNGSALVINGSEGWYDHTTTANTEKYARAGSWTVEIKNSAKLATLPGYVVPIREENPLVPGSMIVTGYEEKTGAGGLLAQISVSSDYTYQTWTPYPANAEQSAKARTHTMWTRVYNPYIKKFDSWMRVYTSATPPTAADIGAPSSVSTSVKTLEVQEWIKIGPVKIYPDRTSQTVKFEWVGD